MPEHVGILIGAARRRLKQAALSRASRHGLSARQFWFLVAVAEEPGASQCALCDRLRVDAPTASRVLAALERLDLVRTERDPGDARRSRLFLTSAGERLAPGLAAAAREIRRAVTADMSPGEVDRLRRGLERVIENLDRICGAADGPAATPDGRRSA